MRIFPKRTAEERRTEIRDEARAFGIFAGIGLVGLGLFLFGGELPPPSNSEWSIIRWTALIAGIFSGFCALQTLAGLLIATTVGMRRAFPFVFILLLAGGFLSLYEKL